MKKIICVLGLLTLLTNTSAMSQVVDEFENPNVLTTTDMDMATNLDLDSVQSAFNDADPQANITSVVYNPLVTYKLRTRVFMGTMVVLPAGESIKAFDLGDSVNFMFVPKDKKGMENVFTLSPLNYGSDTNLVIIGTSGNIYSFYIRADSTKSDHLPNLVYKIQDPTVLENLTKSLQATFRPQDEEQPEKSPQDTKPEEKQLAEKDGSYLRDLPEVNPGQFNYNYEDFGKGKLKPPIRVFDNGYWTWFIFSDEGNLDKVKVPTIYQVVDGYDTLVNVRVDGGSVVAETVSDRWTIRRGEAYRCIKKVK